MTQTNGGAVSQRTMVRAMQALREYRRLSLKYQKVEPNFTEELYEHDLPDWFVKQAANKYAWNWTKILMDLRNGQFFFFPYGDGNITGEYLSQNQILELGEAGLRTVVAYASTLELPESEDVVRSLQLDGFDVDKEKLALIRLEGPVSAQEEEDRLTSLIKASGIPDAETLLKHIEDANSLYTNGNHHASLNESRSLVQALIDGISVETDKNGGHSFSLGAGTKNRIEYLTKTEFFTADEEAAIKSGWGSLSAGSHPGVPDREQARIGLILALEFGQLLLLKFADWKANGYRGFSKP